MISEWEWKNRRISKQTSYTIAADLTKYTDNIAEFDILYNIINSKEFKDSKLDRELKFDYEFDQKGTEYEVEPTADAEFDLGVGCGRPADVCPRGSARRT